MKPLNDYVIIRQTEDNVKKQDSGLELALMHREDVRYLEAEIIAVSDLIDGLACCDKILYDKSAGHKIEIGSDEYKVIRLRDIVMVL